MKVVITREMKDALAHAGHVPDDLRRRFEAVTPEADGRFTLALSEDEAMELAELLQWHVRTDTATGQPTPDTLPYALLIQAIDEQQI